MPLQVKDGLEGFKPDLGGDSRFASWLLPNGRSPGRLQQRRTSIGSGSGWGSLAQGSSGVSKQVVGFSCRSHLTQFFGHMLCRDEATLVVVAGLSEVTIQQLAGWQVGMWQVHFQMSMAESRVQSMDADQRSSGCASSV